MTTPRAFIIRHGETEWSLNGRHTGTTELPLTENGEKRIRATGRALVGDDRLIVPSKLAHMYAPPNPHAMHLTYTYCSLVSYGLFLTTCSLSYVSPRARARRTLELLDIGCRDKLPWHDTHIPCDIRTEAKVQVTEDIREWDYGDYEGLTSAQIKKQREKDGEKVWDIWRDGCPGGE